MTRAGYRGQIKAACRELGRRGSCFDYRDVMAHLPMTPYFPQARAVRRLLSIDRELEVVEEGNRHRPTLYRLRRHHHLNVSATMQQAGDAGPHRTPRRRNCSRPGRRPLADPEEDDDGQ